MKYVYIYCEGQTEESFINTILFPYFERLDIYVTPIIHKTKRTPTKSFRGGVGNYVQIKDEIVKLCSNPNVLVTTMFDYYGMPNDTPAISYKDNDLYKKIEHIEQEITKDIGCNNLRFNLMLHEFESLLFSDTKSFGLIAKDSAVEKLQEIRGQYNTPEHINNSVDTAPSKRIIKEISDYSKVRQGIIVAQNIGIDKMLLECKHFSKWIEDLRNI